MQWNTTYIIVVTAVLASSGTLLATKVWKDLLPEKKVVTWKRVLIAVLATIACISLWKMFKVANGGVPIMSLIAGLFLTNVAMLAWVCLAVGAYLYRQLKRVEAIEQHVGLSKPQ